MDTVTVLSRNAVSVSGSPGSAATIVFSHGFGTDQTAWSDVARAFANDHRIVLFDHVGAGRSEESAFVQHRYLNLHSYARDLIEICDALDLRGAVFVGHSAGAMAGVLAAEERPELFSRLVLVGASPRYLDAEGYRGGLSAGDLDEIYSSVLNRFSDWVDAFTPAAMGNPDRPHLARAFAECIRSIPPARVLTVLCSILQSDHRADVARLAVPTLLIQSSDDIFVPDEVAAYLHRAIAGSRLARIPASGHLPHISAPAEVIAEIRRFLAQ